MQTRNTHKLYRNKQVHTKKKKIYILNWSTLLLNVILVNKLQLKFCFPHDLGIYITIQNIIQGNEGMERQADSIKEK